MERKRAFCGFPVDRPEGWSGGARRVEGEWGSGGRCGERWRGGTGGEVKCP
jgi:hypothetical protein